MAPAISGASIHTLAKTVLSCPQGYAKSTSVYESCVNKTLQIFDMEYELFQL
jgi:hypothetical protein